MKRPTSHQCTPQTPPTMSAAKPTHTKSNRARGVKRPPGPLAGAFANASGREAAAGLDGPAGREGAVSTG
jgi:hypothetical protein